MKLRVTANLMKRRGRTRYDACSLKRNVSLFVSSPKELLQSSLCCGYIPSQDSKNEGNEEEEKQAENGKKEEERGREQEGEREADKTDSEMGTHMHLSHTGNKVLLTKDEKALTIFFFSQAMGKRRRMERRAQRRDKEKQRVREKGKLRWSGM